MTILSWSLEPALPAHLVPTKIHSFPMEIFTPQPRHPFTEVDFLGMIVSRDGIKMDPEKVNAILKWPKPMNVKQVCAFLGLGNFYRLFIKDYTIISRPMVNFTCKNIIFNFSDKEKALFEALKATFTTVPMLQYPDQDHKLA